MKQTEKEKITAYNRINYIIAGVDILLFVYVIYLVTTLFNGD